ncbi:unnamed protein product [Prorocentrum cordatum]|uniref:Ribosome biogenesis protein NOP53 n=1 Tax=Prorocentrum cordatum TaxID=2364126 RepID=A0ABN9TM85_9DINO|nr:unnamed protein product [Polarella glacialis]
MRGREARERCQRRRRTELHEVLPRAEPPTFESECAPAATPPGQMSIASAGPRISAALAGQRASCADLQLRSARRAARKSFVHTLEQGGEGERQEEARRKGKRERRRRRHRT